MLFFKNSSLMDPQILLNTRPLTGKGLGSPILGQLNGSERRSGGEGWGYPTSITSQTQAIIFILQVCKFLQKAPMELELTTFRMQDFYLPRARSLASPKMSPRIFCIFGVFGGFSETAYNPSFSPRARGEHKKNHHQSNEIFESKNYLDKSMLNFNCDFFQNRVSCASTLLNTTTPDKSNFKL